MKNKTKKKKKKKIFKINKKNKSLRGGFNKNSNIYRIFANPKNYFCSEKLILPHYINNILKSESIEPKGLNYRLEVPTNIFSN